MILWFRVLEFKPLCLLVVASIVINTFYSITKVQSYWWQQRLFSGYSNKEISKCKARLPIVKKKEKKKHKYTFRRILSLQRLCLTDVTEMEYSTKDVFTLCLRVNLSHQRNVEETFFSTTNQFKFCLTPGAFPLFTTPSLKHHHFFSTDPLKVLLIKIRLFFFVL